MKRREKVFPSIGILILYFFSFVSIPTCVYVHTGRNKIILLRYSQKATTYEMNLFFIVCFVHTRKNKVKVEKESTRPNRRRDFILNE